MSRNYVLYHANCPDGFGAALAAYMKYQDDAEYLPVAYGQPVPALKSESHVMILDFCYPREELEALCQAHESVTVIDHHKTAEPILAEVQGASGRYPLIVYFNLNESGATLTYEFLHGDLQSAPLLFHYLKDRDLWRWELPDSKAISEAIRSYPTTFDQWLEWAVSDDALLALVPEGTAILRHVGKRVQALCKDNVRWYRIGGYDIPAVNTPLYGSEIGNALAEEYGDKAPFAACYSLQSDGQWRWELRSIGAFNVGEVAKSLGGGGHTNAAGFLSRDPM